MDENGNLFWVGNKKFPHIINYDCNNEFSFNFIYNFSLIIAKILNVDKVVINDLNYIKNYTKNYIPEKIIKSDEKEISEKIIKIKSEIIIFIKNINFTNIHPETFEKDNDSNHHIDFIYNCANLRAQNYNILTAEREIIKQKAGRIIPWQPQRRQYVDFYHHKFILL